MEPILRKRAAWQWWAALGALAAAGLYFFLALEGARTPWTDPLVGAPVVGFLSGHRLGSYLVFSAAALAAARVAGRAPPMRFLGLALTAVVIAAPLVFVSRLYSQDVYDYLIRGRVFAVHHANPFVTVPAAFPDDPFRRLISWPNTPWIYGPVWLFVVAAVAALPLSPAGAVMTIRALLVAVHVGNGALLWRLHRDADRGRRASLTALYLFSPLVVWETAVNAHCDALAVMFLLGGILSDRRERPTQAAVLFAFAAMMKIYTGPVLLFYVCARLGRAPVAARGRAALRLLAVPAFLSLVLYAPFAHTAAALTAPFTGGSAHKVANSWAEAAADLALVSDRALLIRLGNLFTALLVAGAAVLSWRDGRWGRASAWFAFLWCAVGATWFQPWYTTLPLALTTAADVGVLLPATVLFTFLAPAPYLVMGGDFSPGAFPLGVALMQLVQLLPLSVAAAALWALRKEKTNS